MAPSPTPPTKRPRRILRGSLACTRCQRRKIRCDGNVPTCQNCRKASADCVDGESVRLGEVPRAQITKLRKRVQWLESIVRARCPDVDLSVDPDVDVSPDQPNCINTTTAAIDEPRNQTSQMSTRSGGTNAPEYPRVTTMPVHTARQVDSQHPQEVSLEIGLVALGSSQDLRYIGPSSGYFLARIMLSSRGNGARLRSQQQQQQSTGGAKDLVDAMQGPLPFPSRRQAQALCDEFFDALHFQFPILHRPSFMDKLGKVMDDPDPEPEDAFQVFIVLAIGSVAASHRRHLHLPAESYCLSALQYLDRINVDSSLRGLQCLVLLSIFAMHCSNVRLSIWHLNYQCLAAVLDLGLQRNITTKAGFTLLEQEMRTRIFWVIFMLDRRIATMMGRPIGLRDEGCDLRMPQPFSDESLNAPEPVRDLSSGAKDIDFSIHLFKLARLNSEIKYVANSIVRGTPPWAYPAIIDVNDWQTGMLRRLEAWTDDIPRPVESNASLRPRTVCMIHCNNLVMALLRPTPAIPKPSNDALRRCHQAATQNISLFSQLYKENQLVHSWDAFHALVMSAITLMYCIKTVPSLAQTTEAEVILGDMGGCLSILSASGEHWSSAKRCRDIIDDLSRSLVRWLRESGAHSERPNMTSSNAQMITLESSDVPESHMSAARGVPRMWSGGDPMPSAPDFGTQQQHLGPLDGEDSTMQPFFGEDPLESFFDVPWLDDQQGSADTGSFDFLMRSLFDDFIPTSTTFQ